MRGTLKNGKDIVDGINACDKQYLRQKNVYDWDTESRR